MLYSLACGRAGYTLPDPTAQSSQGGTSLVMTDADGEEAGYVLYDAYGRVLSNTLSAELEAALAGQGAVADPDVGLVYLGDGRYYDPAFGRALQPNPVGGPPALPQALNRYAPTPWGAPGVAQAATSNPSAMALWHQTPGTLAGLAIGLAPATKVVGTQLLGQIEISYLPSRGLAGVASRFSTSWGGRQLTRLPFVGRRIAAKYASRYRQMVVPVKLDQGGAFVDELMAGGTVALNRYANARLVNKWTVPGVARGSYGKFYFWRSAFKSAGVAGIISGGFQIYEDWDNPYLTRGQKIRRAVISGGIGFGAALAGAGTGAALGSLVVPGAGTAVGGVVGFGLGLWGELWLAPRVFEGTDNMPERHLAPLP